METFFKDLKQSLRMCLRSPGFTVAAVAALTLGIGANTAIFSVVNAVLLQPLNYPDPDRIVRFNYSSLAKFNLWRHETAILEDIAAYDSRALALNLTGGAYPEQIHGIRVTADYFRLFGAPVARGRTFTADEDRPDGGRVVILSSALWHRRFGGDPGVLGRSISLDGAPYVIVGILGPGFTSDPPAEVWIPFQFDPNSTDQAHVFSTSARLKPGVTLGMANARLQLTTDEFRHKFPNVLAEQESFAVEPLKEAMVGEVRGSLLVLAGAVTCVLLIACANVANLLLARGTTRKREIAIRAAVGAGRGRLIRQLLTEGVFLSIIGGALGLALGILGVRALLAVNPGNIPRIGESGSAVTVDWHVLSFTILVSLGTGVLFGIIPALEASRTELAVALKAGGGRTGTGFRQNGVRSLLVVSEVALALVLLVGTALLVRTFVALRGVDPGIETHNILTLRMSLSGAGFEKTSAVNRLVINAVQRIKALPGVVAAGSSCCLPLELTFTPPFAIDGRSRAGGGYDGRAGWNNVSTGFFNIFKIPILRGRAFTDRDDASAAPVVIINQAMARQFWPAADPLNARIVIAKGYSPQSDDPPRQIVGIVTDVHDGGLNVNPGPALYIPEAQVADGMTALTGRLVPLTWIVRTRVEPHSLSSVIQNELRQASAGLPVTNIRSMDEVVAQSTARQDFNMLLMTVFGCAALVLAVTGIYGVMAYSVQQRTQEIGIRIALGAESGDVRNMVVYQGMRLALIGVTIGIAAAFGLTRLLASFLFGVQPRDPLVFTSVPILLCGAALFAVWLPARRASRVDPIHALRCE